MTEQLDLTPEPGMPRDTRLIERAIRQRWPIPDRFKEAIVKRQVAIAVDPKASNREATGAAKAIVAMEAQNLEQEKREDVAPTGTTYVQNNVNISTTDDGRAELLNLIAALRDRAGIGSHPPSTNGHHTNGSGNGSQPG